MTRLLQRGAPCGERGSSAYMTLTPVFRDGAAGGFNATDGRRLVQAHIKASRLPRPKPQLNFFPRWTLLQPRCFYRCFKLMSCRSADLAGISPFCRSLLESRRSADLIGIKSARAQAKIRRSGCSSSTNLYSCC